MRDVAHLNDSKSEVKQAVGLWLLFIAITIMINGTIPFVLGYAMHPWTYSKEKFFVFASTIYVGMFLVAPLIFAKSWKIVKRASFIIPLMAATVGIILWPIFPFAAASVVFVVALLHYRFNLSELGIRSRGWKGDAVAILLVGVLYLVLALIQSKSISISFANGAYAGLERLFANPASTVENLFYFGFLTERFSRKTGRWLTPLLIGGMYTFHEMTNPEYWYEGLSFSFVFVGIAIFASIYLWRRSTVVTWLTDGFIRFINFLL